METSADDTGREPLESLSLLFETNKDISLELHLPEDERLHEKLERNEIATGSKVSFKARCRPIWLPLTAWIWSAIFTILYSSFIYQVLIQGDPKIGNCVFDASLTNLLLSIFSQLYTMLLLFMVQGLLDALRWSLTMRAGRAGTSASNFFQLSPATDWLSVLSLIFHSRLRSMWGIFRLALPFMGLGFGSVLKFQNRFEYHFISRGPTIGVYAGTALPDLRVLDEIPTYLMNGFYDIWSQQLSNYPRYATSWHLPDCEGNCNAIYLPGGLEIARKVGPFMNATILQGGVFKGVDAIQIDSAPGLLARFDPLGGGFAFDIEKECKAYVNPEVISDGMQMCLRQLGYSVAAGWRGCPTLIQLTGKCEEDSTWKKAPLQTTTLMTVYQQRASTMYDRKDLTIKLVEPTSEAELLQIFATDIWKMWDHTFIPPEDASPLDNQSINVTLSRLAWKYRTYTEFFPDHNVPLEQLRNFLLVPLQFSVTAMQYVNYTMALPPADIQDFALELMTTATGGQSIQKFVSPLWTSLTFIASGCAVVLLSGIAFVRILSQDSPVPTSSGITEIDFASRLAEAGAQVVEEGRGEVEAPLETAPLRDLINVVQRRGEGERSQSNFNTLQRLRIETTGAPSGEGSRAAYHPSLRIVPSRRQEMPMFPPTTRTNQEYDGGGSSDSSVKN